LNELPELPAHADHISLPGRIRELATLFFKLGAISFGGPAAHIALIEDEIVDKRVTKSRKQSVRFVFCSP